METAPQPPQGALGSRDLWRSEADTLISFPFPSVLLLGERVFSRLCAPRICGVEVWSFCFSGVLPMWCWHLFQIVCSSSIVY